MTAMPLILPQPDGYTDWKAYARDLVSQLAESEVFQAFAQEIVNSNLQNIDPSALPQPPAGYEFVWLSPANAELYLANPLYDPPTAPDRVYIDTAALAAAAVEVANLGDNAVTSAKIFNATIATADIGNAQILTALIGDAQIVTVKILDAAVNNAKIANLAVESGKIANLAVGAAHIQLLAVGTAHVQDGSIVNAKIGNTIQSTNWNASTKAGWLIDKSGLIQGRGITLYDDAGGVVFASGTGVNWSAITGAPTSFFGYQNPTQIRIDINTLTAITADTSYNYSAVSRQSYTGTASVAWATGTSNKRQLIGLVSPDNGYGAGSWTALDNAWYLNEVGQCYIYEFGTQVAGPFAYAVDQTFGIEYDGANVRYYQGGTLRRTQTGVAQGKQYRAKWHAGDAGAIARNVTFAPAYQQAIFGVNIAGQMTAANISTFIAAAAIGTALIQNAAITSALIANGTIASADIGNAQIIQALIGNLAVGTAQIADLAVLGAKIGNLQVGSAQIGDLVVGRTKITGGAIGTPSFNVGGDTVVTGASGTNGAVFDLLTTGALPIGDVNYGTAVVIAFGWMDTVTTADVGTEFSLQVSQNGGGFSTVATTRGGVRSSGGDTRCKIPVIAAWAGSGLQTLAVKLCGQSIVMDGMSDSKNHYIKTPTAIVFGVAR